ncbi:hypothetical protein ANN_23296 [Periplaneta americana]|uniref:Uncharacterized protein n=1 Tax=Periplaneta americana TaxID=6978 RepID=A0ABQ8SKT0_PERAM|nr:hypothetical protein ANN_23296 [Periplaneta americana]
MNNIVVRLLTFLTKNEVEGRVLQLMTLIEIVSIHSLDAIFTLRRTAVSQMWHITRSCVGDSCRCEITKILCTMSLGFTVVVRLQHNPDLAPSDLCMFPKLKELHFYTNDIVQTEVNLLFCRQCEMFVKLLSQGILSRPYRGLNYYNHSVEKLLSSSLLSKNLKVRIYKTVILPVVLYGCETWTLTLREEHRLRVIENKVLRKIFGAKRDEVTREWRKLRNTELHALYSSPDIIRNIKSRRLRWAGHVARTGESRNVRVGRPEGKRPLGRPRRRWEDNIKMDLREVGYDRDWINLAQDRDRWRTYVRAAMNLRKKEHLLRISGKITEEETSESFVWSMALYGTKTWTLRRSEEKRLKGFKVWLWRRMERMKWTDRIRNEVVLERVGEERLMLKLIRKRKKDLVGIMIDDYDSGGGGDDDDDDDVQNERCQNFK